MVSRRRTEHPYWLFESIMDTPRILQACLDTAVQSQVECVAEHISQLGTRQVLCAGTGSSGYACLVHARAFEEIAEIPASAHVTSELAAYPPTGLGAQSVLIVTSHSGRTPGDLPAIQVARERGAYTVGITDIPDSPLARAVDDTIIGPGGPKAEMPATRTYDAAIFRVIQLAIEVARRRGWHEFAERYRTRLESVPELLLELLDAFAPQASGLAAALADRTAFIVVGAGANMATAYEGALALFQATAVSAQAFHVEEFLHGPVQAVTAQMCLVAVAAPGPLQERILQVAHAAEIIGAGVLTIAPRGTKALKDARVAVVIPDGLPEVLTPLLYIAPLWLIGYHFSLQTGRDPDRLSMDTPVFQEAIASLMPQGSKFDGLVRREV